MKNTNIAWRLRDEIGVDRKPFNPDSSWIKDPQVRSKVDMVIKTL